MAQFDTIRVSTKYFLREVPRGIDANHYHLHSSHVICLLQQGLIYVRPARKLKSILLKNLVGPNLDAEVTFPNSGSGKHFNGFCGKGSG